MRPVMPPLIKPFVLFSRSVGILALIGLGVSGILLFRNRSKV